MMAVERWRPFSVVAERWEPSRGVVDIQQEMNRLFDSFFGRPLAVGAAERVWVPPVDVCETKDDLVVSLELPGVREKEVEVAITGDLLTVKGERRFSRESKDESFHRMERVYGKFERTIPLPVAVQTDKVKATYRDGVLDIRLPKVEEVKPRQIKIDVA